AAPAAIAVVLAERRAGVVIGVLLPALPELARLGARFQNPGADAPRRAVRFAQQRDALLGESEAAESPLGFCDLCGRAVEGRRERDDAVAEWDAVFRVAFVERLDPSDSRGLVGSPAISARPGLHAVDRRAFARRHVGDLLDDFAAAVPYLDLSGEAVHRHQARERSLDPRHQDVIAAGRRCDVFQDRRATDQRLAPGVAVDGRQLAGEVVLDQLFAVLV